MKHNLSQYHYGDSVVVTDTDGKEYQGIITLFTPAKDNEVDEDAIAIDSGYWFDESDIQSIKLQR